MKMTFFFYFNSTILVFLFKFLNTTWAKHLFENETQMSDLIPSLITAR